MSQWLHVLLREASLPLANGVENLNITSITTDSRQAGPGCLFLGLPGERVDGGVFWPQALEAGAAAGKAGRLQICQFCYANTGSCAARARLLAAQRMPPWSSSLDPTTRVQQDQAKSTELTVAGVAGAAIALPAAVAGGPLLSVGIAMGGLTTAAAHGLLREISLEEMS